MNKLSSLGASRSSVGLMIMIFHMVYSLILTSYAFQDYHDPVLLNMKSLADCAAIQIKPGRAPVANAD